MTTSPSSLAGLSCAPETAAPGPDTTAPSSGARRGACPALDRPMMTGDGLIARLMPRFGAVGLEALGAVLNAAGHHGNGIVEITRRASLQVRGLDEAGAAAFADAVRALPIEIAEAPAILTDPLAGLDPTAAVDPRPLARGIANAVAGSGLADRLAPKATLVIDGGGRLGFPAVAADLRLSAIPEQAEVPGQADVWVLGLGGPARDQTVFGAVSGTAAVAAAVAVLERLAARGRAARARSWLAEAGAVAEAARLLAPFLQPVAAGAVPPDRTGEWSAAVRGGAVPVGLHPVRGGLVAVGIVPAFGACTAETLAAFVRRAIGLGATEARLAAGHGLVIASLDADAARALAAHGEALGLVVRPDDPRLFVAACAGTPGCASAHVAARALAPAVAEAARGRLGPDFSVHLSGCAKACAGGETAALTFVGREDGVAVIGPAGPLSGPIAESEIVEAVLRHAG